MTATAATASWRSRPAAVRIAAAVVYLVLALAWIYAVVAHGDRRDSIGTGVEYSVLPLVYLALGAAMRSWWALLLPVATIVVALPAGENPAIEGDLDWVVFDPIALLPYALLATALGVWSGRALRRRRGGGALTPDP